MYAGQSPIGAGPDCSTFSRAPNVTTVLVERRSLNVLGSQKVLSYHGSVADAGGYFHGGADLNAVALVAERIVDGTRVRYDIDDDGVELGGYSVAVDLYIKDYTAEDRELLTKCAADLRVALAADLGIRGETEQEIYARERFGNDL